MIRPGWLRPPRIFCVRPAVPVSSGWAVDAVAFGNVRLIPTNTGCAGLGGHVCQRVAWGTRGGVELQTWNRTIYVEAIFIG